MKARWLREQGDHINTRMVAGEEIGAVEILGVRRPVVGFVRLGVAAFFEDLQSRERSCSNMAFSIWGSVV